MLNSLLGKCLPYNKGIYFKFIKNLQIKAKKFIICKFFAVIFFSRKSSGVKQCKENIRRQQDN